MSNTIRIAELKATAKERSIDRYGSLILANIIIFIIQLIISGITTVGTSGSIIFFVINLIINLIVNILLGVLVSGKAYLYMNLVYSQPIAASDIFFGLKQNPQKAVIIQSVFVLVDFFVSLPASVLLFMVQRTPTQSGYIAMIIALLVGFLVNLYVSLVYSQSFFLLHDFPERSAKELLRSSRKLMQGNKLKLLALYLSFIPLYLFGILTLFIPLLWISVYRYATLAVFYQKLISNAGSNMPAKEEQNGLD